MLQETQGHREDSAAPRWQLPLHLLFDWLPAGKETRVGQREGGGAIKGRIRESRGQISMDRTIVIINRFSLIENTSLLNSEVTTTEKSQFAVYVRVSSILITPANLLSQSLPSNMLRLKPSFRFSFWKRKGFDSVSFLSGRTKITPLRHVFPDHSDGPLSPLVLLQHSLRFL